MSVASRGVRPLLLAAALVTSLAACASSSADATSASSAPTESSTTQDGAGAPGGDGQGAPGTDGFGGVRGEIAYVADALAQVQGSDEQTAVTWTDDTVITLSSTGSVDDIAAGDCVTVVGGEDEAATAVSVSQPVDGECATPSFGGFPGGGAGGGEMPTDMPSDMPSGERPTDMPSDMPSGEMPTDMPGGGQMGGMGGATTGTVAALDGSVLTVTTEDGDVELTLADDVVVTVSTGGDGDDVVVGLCATVSGDDDGAGTVAATTIALSEPGDEGCTSGFGGGGFGGPPGDGNDG